MQTHLLVTRAAIDKAKEFNKEHPNQVLRVAIKGGGCSGLLYELKFEEPPENFIYTSGYQTDTGIDIIIHYDGLTVVLDQKSAAILENTTLDYVDGLEGSGFKFSNPDAANVCGCGSSFGCP